MLTQGRKRDIVINSNKKLTLQDILISRITNLREDIERYGIDLTEDFARTRAYKMLNFDQKMILDFKIDTLGYNEFLLFHVYNREILQ